MRILTFLFTLFFTFNALAVAPYGIKGQAQSGTLYSNVHQFPNNQVTNTGGINALVETGNKNILVNPSFEHLTFSTGWTNSAGTFTEETVLEIDGLKSAKLVLSSQTMSLTQSSTLYAAQFADGVQGLASVRVKSDVALKVCAIQAGVVSSSLCVDVQANNKWGLYKVPFILGATSNGISIASTGAVSGTVYIDDAFVGAVDLSATADASRIAGEAFFAGTTSCQWTRSSATIGAFSAVAACPGPTIQYSSIGSWQTTDSDLPRITINNLPAGVYKAKFLANYSVTTAGTSSFAINDGTTTCEPVVIGNITTATIESIVECTFIYTSSGNRVFELYTANNSGNTTTISNNQTAPRASTKFILEYFASGSTYSSTNADTDWASCGHTTSDFTGFGTVTNIETQCKRQSGDLLMRGKFTSGTSTAVEARLALKLGGLSLTSAGSSIIPSLQVAGSGSYSAVGNFIPQVLIEPSVSYVTWGVQASASAGASKALGSTVAASGTTTAFSARIPIEGWQNSNIIIGQFNGLESCTDTYQCTDVFSAKVSAAGVVSDENIDWINGNCSGGNPYTCSFRSSLFTVSPNCTVSINEALNTTVRIESTSSSSVVVRTLNYTPASTVSGFNIVCQKQGADYIGKTAKAVASDQNIRTPGIVKSVLYSAELSASGVVSSERGDFINGNCTNAAPSICTFNSGAFASTPNCSVTSNGGTLGTFCQFGAKPSTSSASITCANDSGGNFTTSLIKTIICHGEAP
jgi:hypothetical protein